MAKRLSNREQAQMINDSVRQSPETSWPMIAALPTDDLTKLHAHLTTSPRLNPELAAIVAEMIAKRAEPEAAPACWMCHGAETMTDAFGCTIPCMICRPDECDAACDRLEAERLAAQPLPIPTTPRHGRTNYFPRKPSSFAVTDLTGADAATMEATVRRDFSRFIPA